MCKLLEKSHTNPREICIVGYPQINWQADPDSTGPLKDYLQYSAGRLAHQVGARSQISEACHKLYDEEKKGGRRRKAEEEEEPPMEEFQTTPIFGWPVRAQAGMYSQHLRCLCPILMDLRRLSHTDVDESLQCWTLNLGAIPPLALCLIRGCMLFDASSPETMRLDSILLRELDVPGNLQLIRQRFYSSSSFSHRHIAMQGCQEGNYVDILNHIHKSVEAGSMSACTAVHLLRTAVDYGTNVFVNMVESNSFLSARLTQSMDLMKKLAHEERMGRADFCKGMKTYQRILLQLPGLAVPAEQLWQRAKECPLLPPQLGQPAAHARDHDLHDRAHHRRQEQDARDVRAGVGDRAVLRHALRVGAGGAEAHPRAQRGKSQLGGQGLHLQQDHQFIHHLLPEVRRARLDAGADGDQALHARRDGELHHAADVPGQDRGHPR
jgi:hypothetical protein